jgi:hypothetical protein
LVIPTFTVLAEPDEPLAPAEVPLPDDEVPELQLPRAAITASAQAPTARP